MNKISNKTRVFFSVITILILPFVSFGANQKTLKSLMGEIASYFNQALLLLIGFAVLCFVYYVIKYFIQPNDKRSEAGQYVLYSLIGFFAIVSLWGMVNILVNTFGLGIGSPTTWTGLNNLFPN